MNHEAARWREAKIRELRKRIEDGYAAKERMESPAEINRRQKQQEKIHALLRAYTAGESSEKAVYILGAVNEILDDLENDMATWKRADGAEQELKALLDAE